MKMSEGMPKPKRKMSLFKMCLLLFAIGVLFVAYSAVSILSFSQKNELVKSDAAIVLGAAAWGTKPSPVLKERVNHAIWLYKKGYVDKIIFTGGKADEHDFTESEVSKMYALENKVKEEDILIERDSRITEQNFKYAKEVAEKHGLKTFLVVSDPLHMKRAMTMAQHYNLDAHSSPTSTSAYQSLHSETPFFFRELLLYVGYVVLSPFR